MAEGASRDPHVHTAGAQLTSLSLTGVFVTRNKWGIGPCPFKHAVLLTGQRCIIAAAFTGGHDEG